MSKYQNVKSNGYASKAEERRAGELKLLQRAGKITDLQEQVRYEVLPRQDGERAVHYIADFAYTDVDTELEIVEDVKGVRTDAYILKRKLMLYTLGIKIKEVK